MIPPGSLDVRYRPSLTRLGRCHRRRCHGLLDPLSPRRSGRQRRHPAGAQPADLRHHLAFCRPGAGASLDPQSDRPHSLLRVALRKARGGDGPGDRLDQQGLTVDRHQRRPLRSHQTPGGAGAPVRRARPVRFGGGGEGAVAADERRGRHRRGLVSRRRPRQPVRPVCRARQGSQGAGGADLRGHARHRHPHQGRPNRRRRDERRDGPMRRRRTLRRSVEPQGRRHGRCRGAGVAVRALLSAHRARRGHRGEHPVAVRSRRPSLHSRRLGRAAHRLLRAARQVHRSRPARRGFRLPVAAGRLGPLRADDEERTAPAAGTRDHGSEDAAQRARELHAGRLLPAGRDGGDPGTVSRLRHELGRGRHRRRRRHGARPQHRARPCADGPARGGSDALPALCQFHRRPGRAGAGGAWQALRNHLSGTSMGDRQGIAAAAARGKMAGGEGALWPSVRIRTAAVLLQDRGTRAHVRQACLVRPGGTGGEAGARARRRVRPVDLRQDSSDRPGRESLSRPGLHQ